jgi:hypothetical protein
MKKQQQKQRMTTFYDLHISLYNLLNQKNDIDVKRTSISYEFVIKKRGDELTL